MSNTGFTIGYNCILRDQSLSLATKGLYLVVSSYIGMPEWKLTKNTLNKICGTAYAVEKAWKELLAAGYLKHYTARAASGAFIPRYELMQEPSASAPHAFVTMLILSAVTVVLFCPVRVSVTSHKFRTRSCAASVFRWLLRVFSAWLHILSTSRIFLLTRLVYGRSAWSGSSAFPPSGGSSS